MSNNAIIQAKNLTKKFGDKIAVDHISFSVAEGEIFGFLGPNGAGKTTTIRILTTLASLTEGSATVAGIDVTKHPSKVRSNIGVVPQQLTADNELKGIENLLLTARLQHVPSEEARKRSEELMKLVDLQEFAEKPVKTYSGGMRRRLQLILGLVHTPKILFLDEPTLGLDIQTRAKMWEYIKHLNQDKGLTVFMTTHYLEEADSLCNRIAIIDHGVIKVSASPSQLKEKLGGDILTLELTPGQDMTEFLEGVPEVSEVTKPTPNSYRVKLPRVEKALPTIVEGVSDYGLKITDISFTKPTLEQVFLEVTGRSFRDSEESTGADLWQH
ncbi:MAG: ATP-binding cassette domain-containing protein [Nitrososphaerales archaeon]|jgi:ABC-2 type transport system ATP-binding protein